jgi:LAO/AO transport system kinase
MHAIHSKIGSAWRIGVTGPPGAGKSSLIDCLLGHLREKNFKVGIIAIDPSSPFTGGAVLGDRIRMQKHSVDSGVFIRSVGTRGSHGGLSRSAYRIAGLYDAAGYDYVILETVGVGQTELDVIKIADTTIVVLVPESGDAIQTMKAGLMEIADIFVVNKSDRPGAEDAVNNLRALVDISAKTGGWKQPVVLTNSINGSGIDELFKCLEEHRRYLNKTGKDNENRKILKREELMDLIQDSIKSRIEKVLRSKSMSKILQEVEEGKKSPYQVVKKILSKI